MKNSLIIKVNSTMGKRRIAMVKKGQREDQL